MLCPFFIRFSQYRRFCRDERGSISAFMIVTFLGMFVGLGMAVDFMRHEVERARLQDALDRGILAAAGLGETTNAKSVVMQYLTSDQIRASGENITVGQIVIDGAPALRGVASFPLETFFLKIIGMNDLRVSAVSAASTHSSLVEIALVLDISKSMLEEVPGSPTGELRIDVAQEAAKEFVRHILKNDTSNRVSISLVPFAGSVNLGPGLLDVYGIDRLHNYSSCIDIDESISPDSPQFPTYTTSAHLPHFARSGIKASEAARMDWGWCPQDTTPMRLFSNSVADLEQAISEIRVHQGTGTAEALTWAAHFLDPISRPTVTELIDRNVITNDAFDGRPLDYGNNSLKVVVLMSDGLPFKQVRPTTYPPDMVEFFATEHLNKHQEYQDVIQTGLEARTAANETCTYVKSKNILIYTIGYNTADSAKATESLGNCASKASYFVQADSLNLASAFKNIAISISKLRLQM